jgi:hypothetical protein
MAKLRVITRWIVRLRAQRRTREILLAVALTLAAVAFIVAAISGTDPLAQSLPGSHHVQSGAPHGDADK